MNRQWAAMKPGYFKPTALICHTVKGKGVGFIENNMEWHHKNRVTDEEGQSLMTALEEAG